jgi:signal peptidase I
MFFYVRMILRLLMSIFTLMALLLALRNARFRSIFSNIFPFTHCVVLGDSMEPTMSSGQHLIATRISFRRRYLSRGDIVVLRDPWGDGRDYVKRIVGLPREIVEFKKEGDLVVSGELTEEWYLGGAAHVYPEDYPIWTLGDGEYLLMGDNRRSSRDSRTLGPVPRDKIIGRVWFTWWPRNHI